MWNRISLWFLAFLFFLSVMGARQHRWTIYFGVIFWCLPMNLKDLTLVSKCDNQIPAHDQMCACIKFWVDAFQSVKHYLSLAPFLGEWRLIWLLKLRWWWMPVGWSFGASSLVTHVIDSAQLFYLGCLKLSKEKFLMLMKISAFAHFMEIVPKGLAGQ